MVAKASTRVTFARPNLVSRQANQHWTGSSRFRAKGYFVLYVDSYMIQDNYTNVVKASLFPVRFGGNSLYHLRTLIKNLFVGIEIHPNFISETEETKLIHDLDQIPWSTSQSGRRKQNYGPKANFKKRKAKIGDFQGYPLCTKFVQDKFSTVPSLQDYKTVEQCSIEYRPETGARIDPHIDDCWIWGERIVQLNLLSDSVLTLFPYHGDPFRFNLTDVATYPKVMNDKTGQVHFNPFQRSWTSDGPFASHSLKLNPKCDSDIVIRIPLPKRSLLVMYGEPRYDWEHCILRRDIITRRIVVAYREFTPTYLPNGSHESTGKEILDMAQNFFK